MENNISCTPPEIREAADEISMDLLPQKSKEIYNRAYRNFQNFMLEKGIVNISENVLLAYMAELAKSKKCSTLWSIYSMLRSTINLRVSLDISKYLKLRAFLKQKNQGYIPKKSKVLSKQQFDMFLLAPDELYLMHKVMYCKIKFIKIKYNYLCLYVR